ncbi:hypothetical protein LJB90_03620 [Eubacteriales bacterium OttesenSCG-928-G02]|nr:hypothetical protein [Eubacteriales bacterium OttesenSCG-928-G02]
MKKIITSKCPWFGADLFKFKPQFSGKLLFHGGAYRCYGLCNNGSHVKTPLFFIFLVVGVFLFFVYLPKFIFFVLLVFLIYRKLPYRGIGQDLSETEKRKIKINWLDKNSGGVNFPKLSIFKHYVLQVEINNVYAGFIIINKFYNKKIMLIFMLFLNRRKTQHSI